MKNLLMLVFLMVAAATQAQRTNRFVMPQPSTALQFSVADRELQHLDVAPSANFTAYTFTTAHFINMPYRNSAMVANVLPGVYLIPTPPTVSGDIRSANSYGTNIDNGTGQGAQLPDNFTSPVNPLQNIPH
jgi:hypothetical protein